MGLPLIIADGLLVVVVLEWVMGLELSGRAQAERGVEVPEAVEEQHYC